MPRRIESYFIAGPAGRLEALLEEPEAAPVQACLVCHPHPQYAGTMHNKVVYRIARGFRRSGAAVLRFNFRGVGSSEGVYDNGAGEVEDARAAIAFLRERYPDIRYSLAGFSFGSGIILRIGTEPRDLKPEKLIAVGVPIARGGLEFASRCTLPRFFIQSTNDEYGPARHIEAWVATLPEPKQLKFIEAGDHFFAGALDQLEDAVAAIAI